MIRVALEVRLALASTLQHPYNRAGQASIEIDDSKLQNSDGLRRICPTNAVAPFGMEPHRMTTRGKKPA